MHVAERLCRERAHRRRTQSHGDLTCPTAVTHHRPSSKLRRSKIGKNPSSVPSGRGGRPAPSRLTRRGRLSSPVRHGGQIICFICDVVFMLRGGSAWEPRPRARRIPRVASFGGKPSFPRVGLGSSPALVAILCSGGARRLGHQSPEAAPPAIAISN